MLAAALAVLVSLPTIPAVREWHAGHGELRVARHGGVVLALGSRDRRLGREGYRLEVGSRVRIEARTRAGLFYGRQTVLQLLRAGHGTIPRGWGRDWPSYPERGLMIDNGRRYYSPAWIKRRIRELAYLKLNQLHLHFSDNQGFRIESDSHPEVMTRPHLTKRQVRDIVAYARARHVRVIARARHARSHAGRAGGPSGAPGGRAAPTSWTSPSRPRAASRAS